MALVPESLLAIMQCPNCGGPLSEQEDPPMLICGGCRVGYPIAEGGIPVMLAEAAVALDD